MKGIRERKMKRIGQREGRGKEEEEHKKTFRFFLLLLL